MTRFVSITIVAVALAAATRSECAVAAGDAQPSGAHGVDLFRYVPNDVGLTLEARDLHTALTKFAAGPMFARWKEYPPLARWHSQQREQIERFSANLQRHLGVSWDDLRSRLFGRQWVLGVLSPDHGRSGDREPDGFLLVRAADAELLASAATKLFDAQRAEGRYVGSSTTSLGNRTYVIHEIRVDAARTALLVYDGDFGAAATKRETLERVLKLHAGVDKASASLAESADYRSAMDRIGRDDTVRLFVRPQHWLPAPDAAEAAPAATSRDRRMMMSVWRATTLIAAGVEIGATPRIEAYAGWDEKKLPHVVREVAGALRGEPAAATRIPADSLIAIGVRADLKAIVAAVLEAAQTTDAKDSSDDDGKRRSLPAETLVAARLVAALGPNLTANLTAADVNGGGLPFDWVVGIDTQPIAAGQPSLAETFDPVVRTLMVLAADVVRAKGLGPTKVETPDSGPLKITGLTGFGPLTQAGVFIARQDGRLWCGGSPAALARSAAAGENGAPPTPESYARLRSAGPADAVQFAYFDFAGIRRVLDQVVDRPPSWMPSLSADRTRSGLNEARRLLSLVDAALLEAAIDVDGASLSLTVAVEAQER